MINPKKISTCEELPINIDNPPSNAFFPVVNRDSSGVLQNKKVSLTDLINGLKSKVASIAQESIDTGEYEQPSGSGSGSGSVDTSQFESRLAAVENRLSVLSSSNSYPTHKIILTDGDTSVTYDLPTAPQSASQTITIRTSNVSVPKYAVTLSIATITISGTNLTVGVTIAVSTGQNYTGGTLGPMSIGGTYSCSTAGSFNSVPITSSNVSIASGYSETFSGTLSVGIPANTNNVTVTARLSINDEDVGLSVIASKSGSTVNTGQATILIS